LLDEALGRILAEDVFADRDYPPFNRAAMDGFALKAEDFHRGIKHFQIIDTIYAGGETAKELSSGQCYKIMTGASVPLSANVVVRKEDAVPSEEGISFSVNEVRRFQNIARRAEDLQQGQLVLKPHTKCTASIIALLASLGMYEVLVEKRPSIAVITTGNEVVPVNGPVSSLQIRNSNLQLLKALLNSQGIVPAITMHAADNETDLKAALSEALHHEVVIMSGGVSAGDADYVPQVLSSLAVQQLFHKVAIRPGKPMWCGHKNDTMVFALPGNPFSCLVTFQLFIRYFLDCCIQLPSPSLCLPLQQMRKQKVKLDEFFPAEITGQPSGLTPISLNGSGDIRLGLGANALALHPAGREEIATGETVLAILL